MSSVNLTLDYPLEGTFLTRHSNLSNLKFLMSLYVLNFSNNLSTALLIFIIKVKNIHSCKEVYFLTTSPKTVVVLSQLRYSFILKILVPLIFFFFQFSHCRIKQLIGKLRDDATTIDTDTLISNLEYVAEVVTFMASRHE